MIALRPSTPVVAAANASVPSYDVPIIPTFPVDHDATTCSSPSGVVKPRARPFNQSMTALAARASLGPPMVGHPCERPVPGDSEWTTANPRGTHVRAFRLEIREYAGCGAGAGAAGRCGGS